MALGALDIIIAADTAQLRKGMDTAVGIMQSSTKTMENAAKTAAGAIAGYFAFDAIKGSIQHTLDFADSLSKMSQKVGVSVDALYSMQAAGKLADVDLQTLEKSLLKFNKGLGTAQTGAGGTENALKNLGISLKDSSGHLRTSDQYLNEVADKFKAMPNGIAKSTLAMELFGKSGADMIPLLNGGSEALREYSGIMDQDTAQAAEKFNDSLTTVGLAVDAVWMQMASSLSPTLSAIADDFTDVSKEGKETGQTLGSDLAVGMKVAIGLGYQVAASFSTIGHAMGNFGAAASLLAEGDFSGAKFAWNKIGEDISKDEAYWDARIKKVMSATAETQKDSDAQRNRGNQDLADFMANEAKKEAARKKFEATAKKDAAEKLKAIEEEAKIQKGYLDSYADLQAKAALETYNLEITYLDAYADLEAKTAIEAYEAELQGDKDREAALKTFNNGQISAQIDYYTAMGDTTSAYYLQEEEKMKKLAETGWYTNEQMNAIKSKDNEKFQKEQWKKDNVYWVDLFDNIGKAMDDQFFNAMTGKFTSFGDWLKDMWSSLTNSLARGLSKSLADSIMGTGTSGGGIQNIFKSFGGLAGITGSSAFGSDFSYLGGVTDAMGFTTTSGGTVVDSAGQITKSGTDISSVLSSISNAKTLYSSMTGGLSASIANGFAGTGAMTMQGMEAVGFAPSTAASAGMGISNFGAGVSSPWASAGSGGASGAGAAAAWGAGGYVLGTLGDKAFGAKTQAANLGAVGAAVGSYFGPIGALVGGAIGLIAGGFMGSTKQKGAGYYISGEANKDGVNSKAMYYADMQYKSWFKKKNYTNYSSIPESEMKKVEKLFDSYNYLLKQLGSNKEIFVSAGKYSVASLKDEMAKSLISQYTGIEEVITTSFKFFRSSYTNPIFTEMYAYWVDYAGSINKSVSEAITSSIGDYITTTRSFNEWNMGSGSVDQLKFTADYLTKDFNILSESMGVSGLTVQNYLQRYDEAIKASFTPETITTWKNLGSALMSATDANTKYTESIKALTTYTRPQDMMLLRTGDATHITGNSDGNVTSKMLDALMLIWKEMQAQTTLAQLNRGMA